MQANRTRRSDSGARLGRERRELYCQVGKSDRKLVKEGRENDLYCFLMSTQLERGDRALK